MGTYLYMHLRGVVYIMPDLSSLPITIPMMFLVFQGVVIGFFVLYHFLLGVKRGVKKTLFSVVDKLNLVL